jgi:hypothetical protein
MCKVHFMLEGYDVDCAATMFDDIIIKRYTGSKEQAAAINAAVQPSRVLFADDFESGNSKWHGKGQNTHPESALVQEDVEHDKHGNVLNFQKCMGGGDTFSTPAFECSQSKKCRVSFWMKGRVSERFPVRYTLYNT